MNKKIMLLLICLPIPFILLAVGLLKGDMNLYNKSMSGFSQSVVVVSFFIALPLSRILRSLQNQNHFLFLVEFVDRFFLNSHIILSSLKIHVDSLINFPKPKLAFGGIKMYSGLIAASAERSFWQIEKQLEQSDFRKHAKSPQSSFFEFKKVNLTKDNIPILDELSFSVQHFDKIAIIGASGAGKSSILRLICGLEKPNSGQLVHSKNMTFRYLTQDPLDTLIGHSPVTDMTYYFPNKKPENQLSINESLRSVGLIHKKNDHFLKMSPGERRIYSLACIGLTPFDCLLLDEPTNGLDRHNQDIFIRKLKENTVNTTVIWVTHDISLIPEEFDRYLFIKNGKLFFDVSKEEALSKRLIYYKKQAVINEEFYAT